MFFEPNAVPASKLESRESAAAAHGGYGGKRRSRTRSRTPFSPTKKVRRRRAGNAAPAHAPAHLSAQPKKCGGGARETPLPHTLPHTFQPNQKRGDMQNQKQGENDSPDSVTSSLSSCGNGSPINFRPCAVNCQRSPGCRSSFL